MNKIILYLLIVSYGCCLKVQPQECQLYVKTADDILNQANQLNQMLAKMRKQEIPPDYIPQNDNMFAYTLSCNVKVINQNNGGK